WKTLPGRSQTFTAIDPVSNQPLIWSAPPELFVLGVESHAITLGSGLPKGTFELHVASSVDPDVVGVAEIEVVPFGFSGTLLSLPGTAAEQPLADVAVTRGTLPSPERRVFLAVYDPVADASEVSVWDAGFTTLLDTVPDQNFNLVQRPRVVADAQSRAFWIEQYFDAVLVDRARGIVRRNVDGTLDTFEWTPAVTGGLQLVPGTDLACDDDGRLYFLAEFGAANYVVRFDDPFAAGTLPVLVAPLAATGPEVQLAVDAQGRLLVAIDAQLERWTLPPGGSGVEVERLADLGAAPRDLDVDGFGLMYAIFATRVDVLDDAAQVVGSLSKAQVGLPAKVPFENLLGLGVDGEGNLRLADDPLVDDPQLGASALRIYALDVQGP
ncbi:MAG TPA: hypothetical protein VMT18_01830, partial [Planctomycetota bacterium]|nr:hypothetical protein [Planctomycetota bacterium]